MCDFTVRVIVSITVVITPPLLASPAFPAVLQHRISPEQQRNTNSFFSILRDRLGTTVSSKLRQWNSGPGYKEKCGPVGNENNVSKFPRLTRRFTRSLCPETAAGD